MSAPVYKPIVIDGETIEVPVSRDGDRSFVHATFLGREIESRGTSLSAVLDKWRQQASGVARD